MMYLGGPTARTSYICARCLRKSRECSRRLYSAQTNSAPPPPPPSGAAKLTNRRIISLHGPDAPKLLQGLVTANIRPDSRCGLYAAFLTAQGKVLHDVFIYPTLGSKWHNDVNKDSEPGFMVDVDAEQTKDLMKHLRRHKLRAKVKQRLLEEGELDVWSVWKEDDRWTAHTQADNDGGVVGLTDCRAPGMGQRLLLPDADKAGDVAEVQEAPIDAYTIRRYLRGVPEGQAEIPGGERLPMNNNIDLMGGIDFKKGCYLGQELTIRTHHTGVVRRRILPISLYQHGSSAPAKLEYDPSSKFTAPSFNADIRRDDQKKRSTGSFIAGIGNVGLAMCRLEQMSDLTVSGEGSSFSSGDSFVVQDPSGQELGVEAFVPDWIRGQIREPKIQKRVEAG